MLTEAAVGYAVLSGCCYRSVFYQLFICILQEKNLTCYYISSQYNMGFVEIKFLVLDFYLQGKHPAHVEHSNCIPVNSSTTKIRCFWSVNFSRGKGWSLPTICKGLRSWAQRNSISCIFSANLKWGEGRDSSSQEHRNTVFWFCYASWKQVDQLAKTPLNWH